MALRASLDLGTHTGAPEIREKDGKKTIAIPTRDGGWRRIVTHGKRFVCEQLPRMDNNLFDSDGDGYPELFVVTYPTASNLTRAIGPHGKPKPMHVYVCGRRDAAPGGKDLLPIRQPYVESYASEFPGKWGLLSDIPLNIDDPRVEFTFVTEPDATQPRKVVFWTPESARGGRYWLVDHQARGSQSFTPELRGETQVEDIDHDGTNELIVGGRNYIRPNFAGRAIYKWDGNTYRLWWPTNPKAGYVVDASVEDLNGDGTKEIVAVLQVTAHWELAVYWLDGQHWRKDANVTGCGRCVTLRQQHGAMVVAQMRGRLEGYRYTPGALRRLWQHKGTGECRPVGDWNGNGNEEMLFEQEGQDYALSLLVDGTHWVPGPRFARSPLWFLHTQVAVAATNTQSNQEVLISRTCLLSLDPSVWLHPGSMPSCMPRYLTTKRETLVYTFDGRRLRKSQRLRGNLVFYSSRTSPGNSVGIPVLGNGKGCSWVLVRTTKGTGNRFTGSYSLFAKGKGRYRMLWHERIEGATDAEPVSADLDSDGVDELIVLDPEKGKVRIFSVE